MRNHQNRRRTAVALALAAIFPVQQAWADEVEELTNPDRAEATLSVRYQSDINPLYRQYTGANGSGLNVGGDIDYLRRSEDGEWFRLEARNLGLRTQEAGVSYERQGDWKIGLEYDQIPRYSPYEVWTSVRGVGGTTVTQPDVAAVPASGALPAGTVFDGSRQWRETLRTERERTTFTASKYVSEGLKLSLSLINEEKTGSRMSGVRGSGSNAANPYQAFAFAPEPIDQTHRQIEAAVDYVGSKYQISAGYYGSFFNNQNGSLRVNNGTNTGLLSNPLTVALAPDNSAQQIYVNGAYNFSKDTRANLKVAYSEGKQNDGFISGTGVTTLAGVGRSLRAEVHTTELQASLTSRLTKDLKFLGSWRYEDRDDRTPIRAYIGSLTNNPESHTANVGKVDLDYRLGAGYGLTVGADYRGKESKEWIRKEVREWTARAALRKTMGESVNGSLLVAHSERNGSDWSDNPVIYPVYLADRQRDKVRGMIDWIVTEQLNLQFAYEAYFDRYGQASNAVDGDPVKIGLADGRGQVFSIDAGYTIDDDWKMHAWYARELGRTSQDATGNYCRDYSTTATPPEVLCNSVANGSIVAWNARLKLVSDQLGVGVDGRLGRYQVGAQYVYVHDANEQDIGPIPGDALYGTGILPDTKYVQHALKLYGAYPLGKATILRVDYIYDRRDMDDYTWRNWVYADGTRVNVDARQTTHVFGVSVSHKF